MFFLSFWECGTKDLGFFLCPMLETRCKREKFAFPLPSSKIPIFLIQILLYQVGEFGIGSTNNLLIDAFLYSHFLFA